ncbi:MAG TPA: diaminopimelate epimerase [Chroococcales cyanobacterium]
MSSLYRYNSFGTGGTGNSLALTSIPFEKMQGLGNDFVVVAAADILKQPGGEAFLDSWRVNLPALSRALCDRRYGVGADGLILIVDTKVAKERVPVAAYPEIDKADIAWTYNNSDGSSSKMCGNGLRCAALFARNRNLIAKESFLIGTELGAIAVQFINENEIVVDVGAPILKPAQIPLAAVIGDKFVARRLPNHEAVATCVSMGNPHCVIFVDEKSAPAEPVIFPEEFLQAAREIQALPLFPEGVNVEYVYVEDPRTARVFVLERGSGPTLACASGAAATCVAGVLEGRLERTTTVKLPGGPLKIEWSESDNRVKMIGPAAHCYKGVVELDALGVALSKRERSGVAG